MWNRAAFLFLLAPLALAHVVSMSTGEITVDGPTAVYELRVPMYEVAHVQNPETTLLAHIHFANGHITKSSCHEDSGTYICVANYEFPTLLPDKLDVQCDFFNVTVPNHIHLLTATQGKTGDQVVFDKTTTANELRFRPPSAQELFLKNLTSGAFRVVTSAAGLLFLAGLAVAARNWRDAAVLTVAFVVLEWVAPYLAPWLPVTLSARFLESALALAVAYLAVELLFIPEGSGRWIALIAGGIVGGFAFAGFPRTYLVGANLIQLLGIATFSIAFLLMPAKLHRTAAAALLAVAVLWFGIGLTRA